MAFWPESTSDSFRWRCPCASLVRYDRWSGSGAPDRGARGGGRDDVTTEVDAARIDAPEHGRNACTSAMPSMRSSGRSRISWAGCTGRATRLSGRGLARRAAVPRTTAATPPACRSGGNGRRPIIITRSHAPSSRVRQCMRAPPSGRRAEAAAQIVEILRFAVEPAKEMLEQARAVIGIGQVRHYSLAMCSLSRRHLLSAAA